MFGFGVPSAGAGPPDGSVVSDAAARLLPLLSPRSPDGIRLPVLWDRDRRRTRAAEPPRSSNARSPLRRRVCDGCCSRGVRVELGSRSHVHGALSCRRGGRGRRRCRIRSGRSRASGGGAGRRGIDCGHRIVGEGRRVRRPARDLGRARVGRPHDVRRQAVGGWPYRRLNSRVKCDALSNPTSTATSLTRRPAASKVRAFSSRTSRR